MARRFYIIAGEPSGDRLGGALMGALTTRGPIEFRGVGGQTMTAAGLRSRFDMAELTVMGLSEVLPKLPGLMRRIRETAEDVVATRPDVLITIDSPDFTLLVAAKARKALPDLKVVHYVAPSVWAWRPGRAKKMARNVDHVLALLPFEPPYMHAAGMTCDFVGHPVAGRTQPGPDEIAAFRDGLGLAPDQPALLLAPGSRRGEVRRLMPDFLATVERLRAERPDLAVICPVVETVSMQVQEAIRGISGPVHMVPASDGENRKRVAFASADFALCASGTVTLELAAAGTPMVAAYKTTWLTAQIVRRVIKINTANLINLISGQNAVPEFLQEFATPESLSAALMPLMTDAVARAEQTAVFDDAMRQMGRGGPAPEERAADSMLAFLEGKADRSGSGGANSIGPGPTARHQGRR
ncbi:MAG: lipid-A-disaccharide synthase [Pseudomonadota bacterium]